jgi:hypothetical protein
LRSKRLAVLVLAAVAAGGLAEPADQGPGWTFDVGAQEGYESNAQYTAFSGQSSFVTRLGTRLGRRFPVRRGSLEVGLSAGAALYGSVTDLSRFTWGVAAVGSRQLSRRAEVAVDAASWLGYARDFAPVDETGLLPPYALTRTDGGGASFRYGVSRSLRANVDVSAERYTFDSPTLVDGSTVLVRLGADHGRSRLWRVGGAVEYERTTTFGRDVDVGRLYAGWNGSPVRNLSLSLQAGVGRFGPHDSSEGSVRPTLTAAAAWRFRRNSVSGRVSQYVGQNYGVGTTGFSRAVSVRGDFRLSPRLSLSVGAQETRLTEATLPGVLPDGHSISAGLSGPLPHGLEASLFYSYWGRSDDGRSDDTAGFRSHSVTVMLGRRFAWR